MKKTALLIIILSALTLSCASNKGVIQDPSLQPETETSERIPVDESSYYRSLADYLHRIAGVSVSGTGANTTVIIRGTSSFFSEVEPLYVIDGVAVGTNYHQVNSMLNVRDIAHVRALKGSDASMYGVRGGNGVILITTKK